jgi:hypothetical protein
MEDVLLYIFDCQACVSHGEIAVNVETGDLSVSTCKCVFSLS